MHSDIDLDANGIETEFAASFELLSGFIKMYFASVKGIYWKDTSKIKVIFNKDVLINESQVIQDIQSSNGILSHETMIENHSYIDDVEKELERIDIERKKSIEEIKGNDYTEGTIGNE